MELTLCLSFKIIAFLTIILLFAFFYLLIRLYIVKRRYQEEIRGIRESFSETLIKAKLEIQEQTLKQIGDELHSNIRQTASLIKMHLSMILETPEASKENIIETKSLADELLSDLKALTSNLNTDFINKIGFVAALEKELNKIAKGKHETSFTKKGKEAPIHPDKGIILFRLCQEILNNVLDHAEATAISIVLEYQKDHLYLSIIDNGIGIDMQEVETFRAIRGNTGFINMEKKVKLMEGTIQINSNIGQGTSIVLKIPLG